MTHLTEDERQMLADGTPIRDDAARVEAHLRVCRPCADDVARLASVAARFRAPSSAPVVDELWPSIRERIDRDKVRPLGVDALPVRTRRFGVRHGLTVAAIAAGAVFTVLLLRPSHSVPVDRVAVSNDTSVLRAVSDSVKNYEDEARTLLNRLELQRAMIRPEAAASIDADLKVIDGAIAELQRAIDEDPRNPALRRLLASSYRQKVELLKRAGNAS